MRGFLKKKEKDRLVEVEDIIAGKLFFILFYYRNYPTLRFAQIFFKIEDSIIHRWVIFLLLVLKQPLDYQRLPLPNRQMRSFSDLYVVYPKLEEYIVDGTERPYIINLQKTTELKKLYTLVKRKGIPSKTKCLSILKARKSSIQQNGWNT